MSLGPDPRYRMGELVGVDRARGLFWGHYFLDVNGGAGMGGYSCDLGSP